MATKPELEKQNKELKGQIRKLKEELSLHQKIDPDNIDNDFNKTAMSVIKEDNIYKILELKFNRETGKGVVFAEHESVPDHQSLTLLEQNAIKFLLENIVDVSL